ncbi:N-acetylornithine carbamoyltransferase [Fulvivirga sediminis]|uniref:N-succinylornithine carbamoyltransferase n=1 Tax=Fulvivirga sediminis TaxID=2803949 RepID=A0A937FC20_9BACT|nr:N-acetylornithine carbamoyltransferase [Fulvivirga sediminis]MBL3658125.1 N-acetylornithine carbamoyltransferase [Fulvivirga sediminis]
MKKFISVKDTEDPKGLVKKAIDIKKDPFSNPIGKNKTMGLVFFNPSLRTRMSTQKAAMNLGMNVINMNIDKDGWKIEFNDGAVMDGDSQEHIKDAVKVMSQYVDILGVRTFPGLKDRNADYNEEVISNFIKYSDVPVVSLESATRHPLQSLADLVTIEEIGIKKPKVVLSWAPHPRILPQAVPNSFAEWVKVTDADLTIACPEGYELADEFMAGANVSYNQEEAFKDADIIYAKNWSSYHHYGEKPEVKEDWRITSEKMSLTNNGKFMHCLPIRRNVIATDEVIDNSMIYKEAKNREYAAQAVLQEILENL